MSYIKNVDSSWKGLYKLGGIAALTAIPVFLLDIIISLGGGDVSPHTLTAVDWFALFQNKWLFGLRLLGIINIVSLTLMIPMYFAIYTVHRQVYKACAALAMIIYLTGMAIYISNNAAIPMFVLSSKYMAAATDAQRALLAAAGEAIVAKGADFTPGSFIGFFFTEIAGIAFSIIMLRGRIFIKAAAYAGILGFSFLTIFTVWVTFIPAMFDVAMIIAMVGGLSSMVWYILIGRRFLQL
mgnify:CR=1 FL=1